MNINQVISIALGIIGTAGAVAFGAAWFKAKMNEAQMDMLRKDRDDLIIRLKQRDEKINELETRITEQALETQHLKEKIEFLSQLATGKTHIETLVERFQAHDEIVSDRYSEYIGIITKVLESQQRIEEKYFGGTK